MKRLLPAILASFLLATAGASYTNAQYKFTATAPKGWKQLSSVPDIFGLRPS